MQELHKHKWTDNCHGTWAYTPNESMGQMMEQAFISFCEECSIDFKGRWTEPPAQQKTLFEEV